ncbi:MAG: hypothetical protein AAB296_01750 [Candidatus Desantisbacteria bacterium]|mgnify:CR=1 FL=1
MPYLLLAGIGARVSKLLDELNVGERSLCHGMSLMPGDALYVMEILAERLLRITFLNE